jgi:hypothetical protein
VAALLYTARLYRLPELQTMATSPRASQTRLPLATPLSQHDQRPASTLVAWQFTSSLTASQTFPQGKDCALVNATSGAVNITLPAGSDEIIGLPFGAYKTDVSANAAGLLCAGSNTFADSTTSLTTTTQGAFVGAVWDGTNWRPLVSVGASAASLAATTSVIVGGTGAGAAAPRVTANKTAAGTAAHDLKVANTLRAELLLDANENLVLRNYAADGTTVLGSITLDNTTGLLTSLLGMIIAAGGLTITAGGLTITAGGLGLVAGNLALTSGVRAVLNLPSAADDAAAAALSPTVPVGGLYHTSGAVKQRLA